jgi:type III pantothenate kinase
MQNNLIIDWGNTRVKVAVFKKDMLIQQSVFNELSPEILVKEVTDFESMHTLLCSVSHRSDELEHFLKRQSKQLIKLSHHTPLPLKVAYLTPKTLGYDRLANAAGAKKLSNNQKHCLIIDAGTCLKFDFLHAENGYLGGAISPGVEMRYKALNNYTAALPLITQPEIAPLVGRTTLESMNSGVLNGMLNEIKGVIEQYQNDYEDLTIFITGGDAHFFEKALKNDIFAHDFLTLLGLNEILEFNKSS